MIVIGIYGAFHQMTSMRVTLIFLHISDLLEVDRQNEMYISSTSLQLLTFLALSSSLLQLLWAGVSTTTLLFLSPDLRVANTTSIWVFLGELRGSAAATPSKKIPF